MSHWIPYGMRVAPRLEESIRRRLTGTVWRPIVEYTRRRHLRFRKKLEEGHSPDAVMASAVVSAGV